MTYYAAMTIHHKKSRTAEKVPNECRRLSALRRAVIVANQSHMSGRIESARWIQHVAPGLGGGRLPLVRIRRLAFDTRDGGFGRLGDDRVLLSCAECR